MSMSSIRENLPSWLFSLGKPSGKDLTSPTRLQKQ